jgi:nitrate/nitrite transporter NarK
VSREAVSSAFAAMTSVDRGVRGGPAGGSIRAKADRRFIMLAACAFASLSASRQVWHLAVYVLIDVATARTSRRVLRMISGWFDRRRGVALAAMLASGAVGGIVNPPALQALVGAAGWRRACLVSGSIIAAIGVPIVAFCVRQAHGHNVQAGQDVPGRSISDALRSRAYWTLLVVVFGMTLALNGVLVHLSALLIDRGLPVAYAITVMSALGAGSLAGLITGWLLDRFMRYACRSCCSFAASGVYLSPPTRSRPAIAATCVGFEQAAGERRPCLSHGISTSIAGTLTGVVWMAFGLAGAVGPVLMGRAFDATGSYERMLIAMAVGVPRCADAHVAVVSASSGGVASVA